NVPRLSLVLIRDLLQGPIAAEDAQIEDPIVVDVARGQGHGLAGKFRPLSPHKGPAALVHEDVQLALRVEQGGIGSAVVVKVGPGKGTGSLNAGEYRPGREGA